MQDDFATHLPSILPLLSDYLLQTKGSGVNSLDDTNDDNEAMGGGNTKGAAFSIKSGSSVGGRQARAKRRRERQRRQLSLADSSNAGNDEAAERAERAAATAALPLYVRVIRLLGKLGGRCHDLVNVGGAIAVAAVQTAKRS